MEQHSEDRLTGLELEFDNDTRQQFSDAAKWAKMISVTIFVFMGIALLGILAGGAAIMSAFDRFGTRMSSLSGQGGAIFMIIFIFIVAIVVVVYYFLLNFANKVKAALLSEHIETMNAGLASLKTFLIITAVFGGISLLFTIYNITKLL